MNTIPSSSSELINGTRSVCSIHCETVVRLGSGVGARRKRTLDATYYIFLLRKGKARTPSPDPRPNAALINFCENTRSLNCTLHLFPCSFFLRYLVFTDDKNKWRKKKNRHSFIPLPHLDIPASNKSVGNNFCFYTAPVEIADRTTVHNLPFIQEPGSCISPTRKNIFYSKQAFLFT